ncbi:MAG: hypothetical protein K2F71_03770 [Paramuribaculum sp.]|nr:hypothetical protein [Paramuribaculum sp.]
MIKLTELYKVLFYQMYWNWAEDYIKNRIANFVIVSMAIYAMAALHMWIPFLIRILLLLCGVKSRDLYIIGIPYGDFCFIYFPPVVALTITIFLCRKERFRRITENHAQYKTKSFRIIGYVFIIFLTLLTIIMGILFGEAIQIYSE